MEMVPQLLQHRLQLPLRIAAGLADAACCFVRLCRTSARLQPLKIDLNGLNHVGRDVADDLTSALCEIVA